MFVRKALKMLLLSATIGVSAGDKYYSPLDVKVSPNGKSIFVTEKTALQAVKVNRDTRKVEKIYQLPDMPTGLAYSADASKLYITCGEGFGFWCEVEVASGKVSKFDAGHSPNSPVLSLDGSKLFVCHRLNDKVSVWDVKTRKKLDEVKVTREPVAAVLSKDGKFLFVANHLPDGRANVQRMTSHIDVIDTKTFKVVKSISLPNGAIDLRGICLSNDGKWVLVPSIFARFLVPTNQIERGWINTHALNLIDAEKHELYHTVLLDDVDLGAANPWGVVCSPDDKFIYVSHSATHEVSVINFPALLKKLAPIPTRQPGQKLDEYEASEKNPANDLSFLSGIRTRVKLDGIGPRGIDAYGNQVFVAQYFSDDLGVVDMDDSEDPFALTWSLGPKKKMDVVRTGEMYFNDASICFQQWQTCSTCHPDARTDAVNWDLLNDGIGNPKSTKSMLYSHVTGPVMITGIRADAETAVRAGIRHIQFSVPDESRAQPIDEYLKTLRPIPSPYLVDGKLSKKAQMGKKIFKKADCFYCHSGKYFTNRKKYNVGTGADSEKDREFDTPNLNELYRTRPYLYDGRAADLREVFTIYNKDDKHGTTSNLSEEELDALIEYLLSL